MCIQCQFRIPVVTQVVDCRFFGVIIHQRDDSFRLEMHRKAFGRTQWWNSQRFPDSLTGFWGEAAEWKGRKGKGREGKGWEGKGRGGQ